MANARTSTDSVDRFWLNRFWLRRWIRLSAYLCPGLVHSSSAYEPFAADLATGLKIELPAFLSLTRVLWDVFCSELPAAGKMALTEKSFAKGSEFPPLTKGKLRLYSMRFCPYAQRTRLVLAHKNIPFETVNVHLKQKPDWFLERNPLGLVPVLEQDGKIVYESLITCNYLDDVYPENRLTPSDPYQKARDTMLIEDYGNNFIRIYYKLIGSCGKDEESVAAWTKAMNKLEEELAARGAFFGGDKPAMVDLMIWPWMERIGLLQVSPSQLPSKTIFPKLFSWIQAMYQQPAVKATAFDLDTHAKFRESYVNGTPEYDIGLSP